MSAVLASIFPAPLLCQRLRSAGAPPGSSRRFAELDENPLRDCFIGPCVLAARWSRSGRCCASGASCEAAAPRVPGLSSFCCLAFLLEAFAVHRPDVPAQLCRHIRAKPCFQRFDFVHGSLAGWPRKSSEWLGLIPCTASMPLCTCTSTLRHWARFQEPAGQVSRSQELLTLSAFE